MDIKQIKRRFKAFTSMEDGGMDDALVSDVLSVIDGYEQLQAENVKIKGLLNWWLIYINTDEIIRPPIKETRDIFKP